MVEENDVSSEPSDVSPEPSQVVTPLTTKPKVVEDTKAEENAEPQKASAPPIQLSLTIRDKAVLYATYMPYIKNGALFIPTTREYQLGDPVSMALTLLEEPNQIMLDGQVVWITPNGAQGNRAPGIGVQFIGETGIQLRNKIETILAGSLKADRPTHTM